MEWNSSCFGQFLWPSQEFFTVHTAMLYIIQVCLQLASSQQTCMMCTIAVLTVKNSCDGQRNCPKHVEFHSKNTVEKLMHLVGFVIRNLSRRTVTWTSNTQDFRPTYCTDIYIYKKLLQHFRLLPLAFIREYTQSSCYLSLYNIVQMQVFRSKSIRSLSLKQSCVETNQRLIVVRNKKSDSKKNIVIVIRYNLCS